MGSKETALCRWQPFYERLEELKLPGRTTGLALWETLFFNLDCFFNLKKDILVFLWVKKNQIGVNVKGYLLAYVS